MNKKYILALCSLLAIAAAVMVQAFIFAGQPILWEDDFENGLFRFNSSKHIVHGQVWPGQEADLPNFEEFNTRSRHSGRVIIIGEVVGPSINRIVDRGVGSRNPSVAVALNHVVTPVLVHHIIYLGDEILNDVRVGEVMDVREGYFFVTPETSAYANGIPLGQVMGNFGVRPMESGNRYLIFMHNSNNRAVSPYHYNGEPILAAMQAAAVLRLTPVRALSRNSHPFSDWHRAAMEIYGHLYFDLPETPPPPVIVPRTPNELNIIIQGTPIATAIYDAKVNRLIQDGLGLYRQTPHGLERVGQRVSISHALRRFQYILEPGEYIFKNLNFAETNLPANVQVLQFENSERVALAYYADSPSSSHMELHILPDGTAQLTDRTTNTVIPPTEIYPIPGEVSQSVP